jgi:hypothetical protein
MTRKSLNRVWKEDENTENILQKKFFEKQTKMIYRNIRNLFNISLLIDACMLDKRKRGGIWIAFVAISNVALLAYLYTYSNGGGKGEFLFGLPEAFVVLVGFAFTVTLVNSAMGWYYLGKPSLSELYTPESQPSEQSVETDTEGI